MGAAMLLLALIALNFVTTPCMQLNASVRWAQVTQRPYTSASHGLKHKVAMFAFITRNEAHILPHVLHNIQRAAQAFTKTAVLMVENDSTDNTVGVFNAWLQQVASAWPDLQLHGYVRSFK